MDLNHLKQEPGSFQSVQSEPELLVKVEILEYSCQDGNEQQCVQDAAMCSTPAGTGSINEACCTGDLLNVKQELGDMEIGPTVLQHTDIYYTTNKNMSAVKEGNTIVDDGNEAMQCCKVKKESAEDELRGTKIRSCKYCSQMTTEEDYNGTQYHLAQQNGLQPHFVRQHRAMSLNGFMCETCSRLIYKPCLQSSSKTFVTTSTAAGPSNRKQPETTHNETIKKKQKPMECDVSEKGYSSHTNYQSYTGEKSYHSDLNLAQSGVLTSTDEKPLEKQCNICNAKFSQIGGLTRHMRVHKGAKVYHQCDMCDAKFAKRGDFTRHMRVHSGEKPYQCDMCFTKFSQNGDLTIHMRVHTGEKPYQCDMCNAKFARSGGLTKHKKVHTGVKAYHCDTCDAKFARSGGLTQHMRIHTRAKPYQCDLCNATFSHISGVTKHMSAHTGEKPYQCCICNAKFAHRSSLSQHMKDHHTGEKPYRCDVCYAKFALRGGLTLHMRVHTGEKPYQCDMCVAKFSQIGSLTRHMRVHMGDKPHQCDMCDAKFSKRSGRTMHMKVHTVEKPYQC